MSKDKKPECRTCKERVVDSGNEGTNCYICRFTCYPVPDEGLPPIDKRGYNCRFSEYVEKGDRKVVADALRAGIEAIISNEFLPYELNMVEVISEGVDILGFSGLYFENGNEICSCSLKDFMPCRNHRLNCELVYIKKEAKS